MLAGLKLVALPAAVDTFFTAAGSHFTKWRSSAAPAAAFAAEFYHTTEYLVAFGIVIVNSKEGSLGHGLGCPGKLGLPQFFSHMIIV